MNLTPDFTPEERIIRAKVSLNKSHPFLAYILMNMDIQHSKSTDAVETMAVNKSGRLYWNKEFTKTLDDDELKFVLAHEVGHMITLTFPRRGTRDAMLWNIATDLVINTLIKADGLTPPTDVLLPDYNGEYEVNTTKGAVKITVEGKTAEEVYEALYKVVDKVDGSGQGTPQNGKGSPIDDMTKKQFDKHLEDDGDDNGDASGKGDKELERKWKQKIAEASTYAKMKGSMSASMERLVNNLLDPYVDWRTVLYKYLTSNLPVDFSMRMPSRRFVSTGVYTPSVIKEDMQVIVGVDISGSIGEDEYCEFMSEVMGIADAYRAIDMRVIGWACEVDPRDDIHITNNNKSDIITNKFYGGGGTTMSCLADYITEKNYTSKVCIVLTDGYIETEPKVIDGMDYLFVLSKNSQDDIVKKYGEVTSLAHRSEN